MFYCEACRELNKWPISVFRSQGKCECCDEVALCNDVPSKFLETIKPLDITQEDDKFSLN